jgi:hypothetical protein
MLSTQARSTIPPGYQRSAPKLTHARAVWAAVTYTPTATLTELRAVTGLSLTTIGRALHALASSWCPSPFSRRAGTLAASRDRPGPRGLQSSHHKEHIIMGRKSGLRPATMQPIIEGKKLSGAQRKAEKLKPSGAVAVKAHWWPG